MAALRQPSYTSESSKAAPATALPNTDTAPAAAPFLLGGLDGVLALLLAFSAGGWSTSGTGAGDGDGDADGATATAVGGGGAAAMPSSSSLAVSMLNAMLAGVGPASAEVSPACMVANSSARAGSAHASTVGSSGSCGRRVRITEKRQDWRSSGEAVSRAFASRAAGPNWAASSAAQVPHALAGVAQLLWSIGRSNWTAGQVKAALAACASMLSASDAQIQRH